LRFTRDKRGYETTLLVHTGRRNGRSRQFILYCFRTPPGVKVGRPALDEDAIRWIEEHNPDIEFDWPKILEAQPPAAPPADDTRPRRGRRDRDRPRPTRGTRPPPPPSPEQAREPEDGEPESELELEPEGEQEPDQEPEPDQLAAQAFEQLTHPESEEKVEPPPMPVDQQVGHEQLTRLRARYAELLARITERGGDAERIDALRSQAELLNPDSWVTDEEVRQGIEAFEPKIRDLRAALGLRRRRRSRRGGRRRRGSGEGGDPPTAEGSESSSNDEGE
jgi:ribonuclease E